MPERGRLKPVPTIVAFTILSLVCETALLNLVADRNGSPGADRVSTVLAIPFLLQALISGALGIGAFLLLQARRREPDGERRVLRAIRASNIGQALIGTAGDVLWANAAFSRHLGREIPQGGAVTLSALVIPYLRPAAAQTCRPADWGRERRYTLRIGGVGREQRLQLHLAGLPDAEAGWLAMLSAPAGNGLPAPADVAQVALELSQDLIIAIDREAPGGRLIFANRAAMEYGGAVARDAAQTKGTLTDLAKSDLMAELRSALPGQEGATEAALSHRNGHKRRFALRWASPPAVGEPGGDGGGEPTVVVAQNVENLRQLETVVEGYRSADPVTGLLSRERFLRAIGDMLAAGGGPIGVALFKIRDVDSLMAVQGVSGLNRISIEVASRLSQFGDARAARVSTNEFGLVFSAKDPALAASLVDRAVRQLHAPILVPGHRIVLRIAAGYAISESATCGAGSRLADPAPGDWAPADRAPADWAPADRESAGESLLSQASAALWSTALLPSGVVQRFTKPIEQSLRQSLSLMGDLQTAIEAGELELSYEPRRVLATGRIVGARTLLHWRHPAFGLLTPELFMPLAEQSGLVLEIGAWAFAQIARLARAVNQKRAKPVLFSAALTRAQLADPGLLAKLDGACAEAGADTAWIGLVLSGSLFDSQRERARSLASAITKRGYVMAVDGFYRAALQLDELDPAVISAVLIDRAFTSGLVQSAFRRTVARTAAEYCRERGMELGADGVDTEVERQLLLELGFDYGRGALFGRAMTSEQFLALIADEGSGG